MKLRHGLLFTIALGTVLLAAGCGGSGKGGDDLVVGVYGSLTGNDATFGESTKLGVELALSELQASKQGKIGGLTLRSVVEDDQGRAEEAATVVQKLINQDQVAAVIGEVASSRSLAAAPICQAAGVPMITPSSTNPKVTEVGDVHLAHVLHRPVPGHGDGQVRRAEPGREEGGDPQGREERLLGRPVAVLHRGVHGCGRLDRGRAGVLRRRPGLQCAAHGHQGQDPEAIFIPGYYTEVGLIARKARELGLTCPLLAATAGRASS
jgi:branched-chain amino acid transport system substrate-binding protein